MCNWRGYAPLLMVMMALFIAPVSCLDEPSHNDTKEEVQTSLAPRPTMGAAQIDSYALWGAVLFYGVVVLLLLLFFYGRGSISRASVSRCARVAWLMLAYASSSTSPPAANASKSANISQRAPRTKSANLRRAGYHKLKEVSTWVSKTLQVMRNNGDGAQQRLAEIEDPVPRTPGSGGVASSEA